MANREILDSNKIIQDVYLPNPYPYPGKLVATANQPSGPAVGANYPFNIPSPGMYAVYLVIEFDGAGATAGSAYEKLVLYRSGGTAVFDTINLEISVPNNNMVVIPNAVPATALASVDGIYYFSGLCSFESAGTAILTYQPPTDLHYGASGDMTIALYKLS